MEPGVFGAGTEPLPHHAPAATVSSAMSPRCHSPASPAPQSCYGRRSASVRTYLVAVDGELGNCRGRDHPVLSAAVQAAAQVFSGESGFDADLDAGALRCERHAVGLMRDSASM